MEARPLAAQGVAGGELGAGLGIVHLLGEHPPCEGLAHAHPGGVHALAVEAGVGPGEVHQLEHARLRLGHEAGQAAHLLDLLDRLRREPPSAACSSLSRR
mgnify:CR=1 FL=1